jgi:hypothetical protein
MSRVELGTAIHSLKEAAGLGGADNLIIHIRQMTPSLTASTLESERQVR